MKTLLLLLVSFLVTSSCFPAPAHCRNQAEKLKRLLHAKMMNEVETTTSRFKPVEYPKIVSRLVVDPEDSKEGDLIVRLPGQPEVTFRQYGGYITVEPMFGRSMYYYFAEAQVDKKDDLPLVLWLNGGPGCSSLGYGAMTEVGPFRVGSDGKTLFLNKYAWNKVANVLFVESPPGVGFSYSNTTSDYSTGDFYTAEDNYVFLQNWLQRFPEYRGRDFYIAGESYAGHYVPQLAHVVVSHRNKPLAMPVNLKGILIGNPVLNEVTDLIGTYDYFRGHAMASPEVVATIDKHCDFSPDFIGKQTTECRFAYHTVETSIAPIFAYNIYAEDCNGYADPTRKPFHFNVMDYDECSPRYVDAYLNRADVQKAMHANTTGLPYRWTACSDIVNYNQTSSSVIVDIQVLLANNVSVWIFSGDLDARMPFRASQYSIQTMNLTVEDNFHPWFIAGQVGGYTETYAEGLTFATVRGAGHEVPSYQPLRALSLFMHFIGGTPLPDSKRY